MRYASLKARAAIPWPYMVKRLSPGQRLPDETGEGGGFHRRERRHGRFARAVKLPFPVEPNAVDALFEKGVLSITLPRLEADKPRRIAVRAA